MSAYFVLAHTITDPRKYRQEYIPGVMPFLGKHKRNVVVAEPEAKPLEEAPAKGVVVLRFLSSVIVSQSEAQCGFDPTIEAVC